MPWTAGNDANIRQTFLEPICTVFADLLRVLRTILRIDNFPHIRLVENALSGLMDESY